LKSDRALTLGAIAGLLLALVSVLSAGPSTTGVPTGAVAMVGDTPISTEAHLRAVNALLRDTGLTSEQASDRALERLIDEELAVQHARDLGLGDRDPRVRALLVETVVRSIQARAEDGPQPTERDLQALYQREPGRFSATRQLRVRHAVFTGPDAIARARNARKLLAEGANVKGDGIARVPDALIPLSKLRDYVGDAPARAAAALNPGEVSAVVDVESGAHIVAVVEASGGKPAPFLRVRDAVEAQWRRERSARALGAFFTERRAQVPIQVSP
jgi:parvulin-like peptidyl-prolyl isomerase